MTFKIEYSALFLKLANNSWPLVENDIQWFIDHGDGKKMYLDEVDTTSHTY